MDVSVDPRRAQCFFWGTLHPSCGAVMEGHLEDDLNPLVSHGASQEGVFKGRSGSVGGEVGVMAEVVLVCKEGLLDKGRNVECATCVREDRCMWLMWMGSNEKVDVVEEVRKRLGGMTYNL